MRRKRTKFWGLFTYQPRWGLSIRGWLAVLGAIALLFWLLLFRLEPFLAYSAPVEADILIIEGWIADEGVMGAIAEFERYPYELLITAGSNFGRGEYLSQYRNFANLAKATLVTLGVEPQVIQPIPTPPTKRDRTLASATEVKKWLAENKLDPEGINVYTVDVHSRRTWLLYKRVFAPNIPVGVISHPPLDYDPQSWWTSSEGFRKVFSESLAYIYAKFL